MGKDVHAIDRSWVSFFSGTLLSRISGFLRDLTMAYFFGASASIAAFMVAFRLSNLFRRLFAETPLTSSFIPLYKEKKTQGIGTQFFFDSFFSIGFGAFLFVLLIEGILACLLHTPIFAAKNRLILVMMMLMLPNLFFLCLFGLSSAYLQAENKFFLSGVAPVGFNLVWIASVLLIHNHPIEVAVKELSISVVLAFALQMLCLMPTLWKELQKRYKKVKIRLFSSEFRQILSPFLLGMLGISAMQINYALDTLFARHAELEGPAYLWYAMRIQQMPISLFGVAITNALLPKLSGLYAKKERDQYESVFIHGLSRAFSLLIPISIGFVLFGFSGIHFLYGRGEFTKEAVEKTTQCLIAYGSGLIPMAFQILFSTGYYAQKCYTIPTRGALISVVSNILLNALFVFYFHFGAFAIALSTAISNTIQLVYLVIPFSFSTAHKKLLAKKIFQYVTLAIIAASITVFFKHLLGYPAFEVNAFSVPTKFGAQMLYLATFGGSYLLLYFIGIKGMKFDKIENQLG